MPDPSADHEPELLTITEAADVLRAPVATLRYWRHLGTGPTSFRLRRRVLYRRADPRTWLAPPAAPAPRAPPPSSPARAPIAPRLRRATGRGEGRLPTPGTRCGLGARPVCGQRRSSTEAGRDGAPAGAGTATLPTRIERRNDGMDRPGRRRPAARGLGGAAVRRRRARRRP